MEAAVQAGLGTLASAAQEALVARKSDEIFAGTCQDILTIARQLYSQEPDWVTFFRVILGLDGVVRQAFPSREAYERFLDTDEWHEIQGMLADLRARTKHEPTEGEPQTVITIRLPKPVHDALKAEAHEHRTSMNKLCVAKLLVPASADWLDPVGAGLVATGD